MSVPHTAAVVLDLAVDTSQIRYIIEKMLSRRDARNSNDFWIGVPPRSNTGTPVFRSAAFFRLAR